MPDPLGLQFEMRSFVDTNYAGETMIRRSRSKYIVFLNSAPIYSHSKKQNSGETSTFGIEFVELKQSTEYIRGIFYNLRMFGIPVTEPSFFYGDNQSLMCNITDPQSTLKENSNGIAFHFV